MSTTNTLINQLFPEASSSTTTKIPVTSEAIENLKESLAKALEENNNNNTNNGEIIVQHLDLIHLLLSGGGGDSSSPSFAALSSAQKKSLCSNKDVREAFLKVFVTSTSQQQQDLLIKYLSSVASTNSGRKLVGGSSDIAKALLSPGASSRESGNTKNFLTLLTACATQKSGLKYLVSSSCSVQLDDLVCKVASSITNLKQKTNDDNDDDRKEKITTSDNIESNIRAWSNFICTLCGANPDSAADLEEYFEKAKVALSTAQVRDIITSLLTTTLANSSSSLSAKALVELCQALGSIFAQNDVAKKKIFGPSESFRDAFVLILGRACSKSTDPMEWFLRTYCKLLANNNSTTKLLYSTSIDVRRVLVNMVSGKKIIMSDNCARWWCTAVSNSIFQDRGQWTFLTGQEHASLSADDLRENNKNDKPVPLYEGEDGGFTILSAADDARVNPLTRAFCNVARFIRSEDGAEWYFRALSKLVARPSLIDEIEEEKRQKEMAALVKKEKNKNKKTAAEVETALHQNQESSSTTSISLLPKQLGDQSDALESKNPFVLSTIRHHIETTILDERVQAIQKASGSHSTRAGGGGFGDTTIRNNNNNINSSSRNDNNNKIANTKVPMGIAMQQHEMNTIIKRLARSRFQYFINYDEEFAGIAGALLATDEIAASITYVAQQITNASGTRYFCDVVSRLVEVEKLYQHVLAQRKQKFDLYCQTHQNNKGSSSSSVWASKPRNSFFRK